MEDNFNAQTMARILSAYARRYHAFHSAADNGASIDKLRLCSEDLVDWSALVLQSMGLKDISPAMLVTLTGDAGDRINTAIDAGRVGGS